MRRKKLEGKLEDCVSFLRKYARSAFVDGVSMDPFVYFDDEQLAGELVKDPVLFRRVVSGIVHPGSIGSSGLTDFIEDYEKVWQADSSMSHSYYIASCFLFLHPKVIFDMCCGDGTFTEGFAKIMKVLQKTKVVAIDRDMDSLTTAVQKDIKYADFILGEVNEKGKVVAPDCDRTIYVLGDDVLNTRGNRFVFSSNACGFAADYVAKFVAVNSIDYFDIRRCHYSHLEGRAAYSDLLSEIPMDWYILDMLKQSEKVVEARELMRKSGDQVDFMPIEITPMGANVLLADVYRKAMSLDLALEMTSHGYDADVCRSGGKYVVYGLNGTLLRKIGIKLFSKGLLFFKNQKK